MLPVDLVDAGKMHLPPCTPQHPPYSPPHPLGVTPLPRL